VSQMSVMAFMGEVSLKAEVLRQLVRLANLTPTVVYNTDASLRRSLFDERIAPLVASLLDPAVLELVKLLDGAQPDESGMPWAYAAFRAIAPGTNLTHVAQVWAAWALFTFHGARAPYSHRAIDALNGYIALRELPPHRAEAGILTARAEVAGLRAAVYAASCDENAQRPLEFLPLIAWLDFLYTSGAEQTLHLQGVVLGIQASIKSYGAATVGRKRHRRLLAPEEVLRQMRTQLVDILTELRPVPTVPGSRGRSGGTASKF